MLEAIIARNPTEKLYVEDVFQTYLYSGTGSSQTITTGVDLSTNSGMVWIKGRSGATDHAIYDTARGVQKDLVTNSTAAQTTQSTGITAFSSTGFTIGALAKLNTSAATYASWTFRKAPKFFDVVTYTGNGNDRTIPHNLGVKPGMYIIKCISSGGEAYPWMVWHRSATAGNAKYLMLNSTDALGSGGSSLYNDTDLVTSSVFAVGSNAATNASGQTYIAYLFAHDDTADGIVQCGTFSVSGASAEVNLGFEPQYLLTKRIDGTGSWLIHDIMRGMSQTSVSWLVTDLADAEGSLSTTPYLFPTATGFRSENSYFGNTTTYIYLAIRRGPMRKPTDATKVFSSVAYTGDDSNTRVISTGFPPDMIFEGELSIGGRFVDDRLRGMFVNSGPVLRTFGSDTETNASYSSPQMNGWQTGNGLVRYRNTFGTSYALHAFRRAPGFFDVVCYTGTGAARTVNHNLGVAPEMMIVKCRSNTNSWAVYTAATGKDYALFLNDIAASGTIGTWNNTNPTSSVFSLSGFGGQNAGDEKYVAYLFASCPGVSKVGSYTGNGSSQDINCGFTNGARFVLIKRTDSTGDWYVWDTARGIVAANDPHLSLNTTAAEVTTNDSIDPLSTGFTVNQDSATNVNVNTATYIYLAIA